MPKKRITAHKIVKRAGNISTRAGQGLATVAPSAGAFAPEVMGVSDALLLGGAQAKRLSRSKVLKVKKKKKAKK